MPGPPAVSHGEREALAALVADLTEELDALAGDAGPADDEHDAEGSTVGFERARVAALLQQTRRRLSEMDAAAQRRREGRYGICEGCGGPIPAERLAALPSARRCVSCSGR